MNSKRTGRAQVKIALMALAVAVGAPACACAATIEHNLVVQPDFTTSFDFNPGTGNSTSSYMIVPVPAVTLAPGDVLRVGLEFADGLYLKRIPTLPGSSQSMHATLSLFSSQELSSAASRGVDGMQNVQIFDRSLQLADEASDLNFYSVHAPSGGVVNTRAGINRSVFSPEQPNPETIGKVAFEIVVPTTLRRTSTSETIPYPTTTFTMNEVRLNFSFLEDREAPSVQTAILVVPEPGGLMIAGFFCAAMCGCRVRRLAGRTPGRYGRRSQIETPCTQRNGNSSSG